MRLIAFLFKIGIDFLIKRRKKPAIVMNSLALVRLDAIGDYVLFRNFIKILKNSDQYKDYDITLIGNMAWKDLSEELDNEFVYRFIWLDINSFHNNFIYRYKKLKYISSYGYEQIVSPAYSREFFSADNIIKLVHANTKIGSVGNLANIKKWQKNISDKYYTRLIPAKTDLMFEFNRNKEFFENLLDCKLHISKPFIEPRKKPFFQLPKKYAVLFIGASASFRKWNVEYFAKLGIFLKDEFSYEIILCGSKNDLDDASKFKNNFTKSYIDLVGKTTLLELLDVIYNADLMITNETSAAHFAVALEMHNVFVIYNGTHYGRFVPYPEEMSHNYHVIYHPKIQNDLDNYKKISNIPGHFSSLDINEISFDIVKNNINKVLGLKC